MLRITLLFVGLLAALSGFAQRLTGTVTTTINYCNSQPTFALSPYESANYLAAFRLDFLSAILC